MIDDSQFDKDQLVFVDSNLAKSGLEKALDVVLIRDKGTTGNVEVDGL